MHLATAAPTWQMLHTALGWPRAIPQRCAPGSSSWRMQPCRSTRRPPHHQWHDAFPRHAELQPHNHKPQTSCSTARRLTRQRDTLDFKSVTHYAIKRDAGIGSGRGGEESSRMHGGTCTRVAAGLRLPQGMSALICRSDCMTWRSSERLLLMNLGACFRLPPALQRRRRRRRRRRSGKAGEPGKL
jgi:hypothetical protein